MGDVCEICGRLFNESVYRLKRTEHHIDGNHDNKVKENEIIVHFGCHLSLHMTGENNSMFGRHHTEEAIKRISLAKLGNKNALDNHNRMTEEAKRKIAISMYGNTNTLGHKQTREHVTRNLLSRKIGRKNYAKIESDLIWDGEKLVNINEIFQFDT